MVDDDDTDGGTGAASKAMKDYVGSRMEPEQLRKLDELAAALPELFPFARPSRGLAMRVAVDLAYTALPAALRRARKRDAA